MGVVEDFEAELDRQFTQWAETTCPNALKNAIDARCTDGAHRTGVLAKSVGSKRITDTLYLVGTTAYYGKWVDEGRGRVVPINKKVLVWKAPSGDIIHSKHSNPSVPRMFIEAAVSSLQ